MKQLISAGALALFGLANHAHADVCVTSGDSATLANLLNNTSPNQAGDITIRLERGTYNVGTFISSYNKHAVAIRGGYDTGANCSGARWIEPTGTIIDFGGNVGMLLTSETANPVGSVVLEGVTLRHGTGLGIGAGYVNVDPYDFSKDKAGNVTISHTHISDFVGNSGAPVTIETVKGTLNIDNSLFDSIVDSAANQACGIELEMGDDVTVNLRYVTAALYGGKDFCLKSNIRDGTTYKINLQNSIVYEADNAGGSAIRAVPWAGQVNTWQFNVTASVLQNYIDQNGNYSPPNGANANYPNFVDSLNADPASRDFQVLYNSVAINTGSPNVAGTNGTDMSGGPRVIGSKPDAGAYESQVDDTISYVVTNTNDSGAGSLRAAIAFANKVNDPNTITFNLPCPSVIKLSSQLNVDGPVVIDGYSNPGATYNTDPAAFNAKLCVVLEEASLGSVVWAFNVQSVDSALTVHGLAFDGFYQPIRITSGYGHEITGNQFGGHFNGALMAGPLTNAIFVHGIADGALKIGGITPGERNVIAGAVHDGIVLDNTVTTNNCHIDNNLIGLDSDGVGEYGNGGYGIQLQSKGCYLTKNRIAANGSGGVYVYNDNNTLQTNVFGMNVWGNATNSPHYAVTVNGSGNAIGPRMTDASFAPSLGNIAVFMGAGGVQVIGGVHNAVRANLIDFNGPQNDRSAADVWMSSFANNDEPAPMIDSLTLPNGAPTNGSVPATANAHLDSVAFTSFRIDAYYSDYCTPDGKGHAQWYLATQVVSTNNSGHVAFAMPLQLPQSPTTSALSLTATDMSGNTSAYSMCFPIKNAKGDGIFKNGFDP